MAEWNGDKRDRWTPMIEASHPLETGAHDAYATAMEMVGNRHSKVALVQLVCWLVQRVDDAEERLRAASSSSNAGVRAIDPLDRAKQIRDRIDALDAEREQLWQEYLRVLPAGTVDADDIEWAQGRATNGVVRSAGEPK